MTRARRRRGPPHWEHSTRGTTYETTYVLFRESPRSTFALSRGEPVSTLPARRLDEFNTELQSELAAPRLGYEIEIVRRVILDVRRDEGTRR